MLELTPELLQALSVLQQTPSAWAKLYRKLKLTKYGQQ